MPKKLELIGKKFNRWTVLWKIKIRKPGTHWICKCDCGNFGICKGADLKTGNTKSCGCLHKEMASKSNKKHGLYKTKLYRVWHAMKDRCYNHNDKKYTNYGGRGITVCNQWKYNFADFYSWAISNGYKEGLSIDRINNNGNYEPSNCRFADVYTQANNKTTNTFLTYKGESKTLSQWARETGIDNDTIKWRIKRYGLCDKVFAPVDIRRSCSARRMQWPSSIKK